MPLTPAIVEALTRFFGVGTAVAVAAAGLWRFWTWWRDRDEQGRLTSAAFFAQSTTEPWHKAFGDQELTRIYFRRLTGIDRKLDRQALIRLHQRFGQADEDWQALRMAGRFIRTRSGVAHIRKPDRWDGVVALVAMLLCLALLWLGSMLLTFAFNLGLGQIGKDARLETLVTLLLAILYGALSWFGALGLFLYVRSAFTARHLRRRLLAIRKLQKHRPRSAQAI